MRTWARTPNTGSVGSTLIHSRLGNGSTSDTPPQEEASKAAGTKILEIKCHSLLLNVLTFQSLWRQGSRTTAPSQCHPRIFMARMHASTHACHSTLPAYNACSVFYLLGNMYLKDKSTVCVFIIWTNKWAEQNVHSSEPAAGRGSCTARVKEWELVMDEMLW